MCEMPGIQSEDAQPVAFGAIPWGTDPHCTGWGGRGNRGSGGAEAPGVTEHSHTQKSGS